MARKLLSLFMAFAFIFSINTSVYAAGDESAQTTTTVSCVLTDENGNEYVLDGIVETNVEPRATYALSNNTSTNSISYTVNVPRSIVVGAPGSQSSLPTGDGTGAATLQTTIYFDTGLYDDLYPVIKLTSVKNVYTLHDLNVSVYKIDTLCESSGPNPNPAVSDQIEQKREWTTTYPAPTTTVNPYFSQYVFNGTDLCLVQAKSTFTLKMGSQRTWTCEVRVQNI